jgi:hypothetical protein
MACIRKKAVSRPKAMRAPRYVNPHARLKKPEYRNMTMSLLLSGCDKNTRKGDHTRRVVLDEAGAGANVCLRQKVPVLRFSLTSACEPAVKSARRRGVCG